MILNYDDHKRMKTIEKLIKNGDNERKILNQIKPLRYKTIDNKFLNKVLDHFVKDDEDFIKDYKFDEDLYIPNRHKDKISFMDYFTRKLKPAVDDKIKSKVKDCKMIIPNECYIESIGEFDKEGTPDNQILRLKKESGSLATKDLKKLDIDISGYNYINMKLLVTFYHRIHSPVNGKIVNMIPVEGTDDFFGKNSLWILEFETEKSPVYLMLVGESTIQDFDFLKEKTDDINIYDVLGYFNWGSQTVLLYNPKDFGELNIEEKGKYFAGDCIFKNKQ